MGNGNETVLKKLLLGFENTGGNINIWLLEKSNTGVSSIKCYEFMAKNKEQFSSLFSMNNNKAFIQSKLNDIITREEDSDTEIFLGKPMEFNRNSMDKLVFTSENNGKYLVTTQNFQKGKNLTLEELIEGILNEEIAGIFIKKTGEKWFISKKSMLKSTLKEIEITDVIKKLGIEEIKTYKFSKSSKKDGIREDEERIRLFESIAGNRLDEHIKNGDNTMKNKDEQENIEETAHIEINTLDTMENNIETRVKYFLDEMEEAKRAGTIYSSPQGLLDEAVMLLQKYKEENHRLRDELDEKENEVARLESNISALLNKKIENELDSKIEELRESTEETIDEYILKLENIVACIEVKNSILKDKIKYTFKSVPFEGEKVFKRGEKNENGEEFSYLVYNDKKEVMLMTTDENGLLNMNDVSNYYKFKRGMKADYDNSMNIVTTLGEFEKALLHMIEAGDKITLRSNSLSNLDIIEEQLVKLNTSTDSRGKVAIVQVGKYFEVVYISLAIDKVQLEKLIETTNIEKAKEVYRHTINKMLYTE